MARIVVWKEPGWGSQHFWFAPRWSVDDGQRTTVADSWEDAMHIACVWAKMKRRRTSD